MLTTKEMFTRLNETSRRREREREREIETLLMVVKTVKYRLKEAKPNETMLFIESDS